VSLFYISSRMNAKFVEFFNQQRRRKRNGNGFNSVQ